MGKKVKIITYCTWTSIGSILQSCALVRVLKDCGYDSVVWLEDWNRRLRSNVPGSFKDLLKWIYKIPVDGKIKQAHKKRQGFVSEHIQAEYFFDYQEFEQRALENKNDVYLAGSDQIWNPDRSNPIFFLDFVKDSKRISYAASMGKTEIFPKNEELFRSCLRSLACISVREQECADVLSAYTDKEIFVHIDPTFLINTATWRSLEHPYKVKKAYILLYMLYWDNSYKEQIVALKKRTGLPVYAICSGISGVCADKRIYDAGVEEFLWLVDHAEYVITSSFHGVAFSIIFQKKFAAVINPASPSRIENVLNILSVPRVKIEELDHVESIDYSIISANIEKERQRSIEYLKEAIG